MALKSRAHQYRERAEQLRLAARYLTHLPSTRDDLIATAEQYEQLSERQRVQEAEDHRAAVTRRPLALFYAVGAAAVLDVASLAVGSL